MFAAAVSEFNPLTPGSANALILFGSRVGGMMLIAPVFSSTIIPKLVRVGLLVLLTILLQPVALASVHVIPQLTPVTVLSETIVGMAIGIGAAIIVAAAETAGDVMAIQIGLSGAAILDPLNSQQSPLLGSFLSLFAVTVLVTLNLHTVMLGALADSTQTIPVGSPISMVNGIGAMLQLGGTLFLLGVRFAAPVIASVLIANIAIAILGRAAPQLNILSVAFPIQIVVGLVTLTAVIPAMARILNGWSGLYDGMLGHLVRALAPVATH